jgi:RTX calcium-binding nonapeptide repeat (4 copies)
METITGTNGQDILAGTDANDKILGLAGDDTIIGSLGVDTIDGGAGNDLIDYSSSKGAITIGFNEFDGLPNSPVPESLQIRKPRPGGSREVDNIKNIETIIGPATTSGSESNTIQVRNSQAIDVDLSKDRFTYSSAALGSKTLTVKNFNTVIGTTEKDRIKGNDSDNDLRTSRGIIFGSKGNDALSSPTIDYSDLGRAVKFVPVGSSFVAGGRGFPSQFYFEANVKIDKNGFGLDTIERDGVFPNSRKIIGATNKANLIDASTSKSFGSVDVDLKNNSLKFINEAKITSVNNIREFTLVNFVDVVGSKYNDKIVGANKKGKLTGGGGSDTITGGNRNDVLTGSDSTARGVGEVDVLTGGGGRDKFVLGDANGAYYVGKGKDDYATINDFNLLQDSIDLGGFKDYSFGSAGSNSIELYSGKDVNTRDLIAKIQLSGGGINLSTANTSGLQVESAISSQINILSGASSTAEAVV